MNKDNQLIFEAYKNRPLNENMPYPTFAKLSKHASPKSSKEKPTDEFRQQMPDSKEEYSAHDYAKEMEVKGEGEESACIEDLAAKHGVSVEEIQQQLEMGIKVETKHTDDFDIATKIATDHLSEDPHYYTKLAKMERGENAESSAVHPDEKKYGELIKAREESEQRFKDWLKKQRAEGKAKNYPQKDENEERRLDPKCWKGYHKQGTKLKDGKRVNNCVKN